MFPSRQQMCDLSRLILCQSYINIHEHIHIVMIIKSINLIVYEAAGKKQFSFSFSMPQQPWKSIMFKETDMTGHNSIMFIIIWILNDLT